MPTIADTIALRRGVPPASRKMLRQKLGGKNALYDFLEQFAYRDKILVVDDFTGKALDTTNDWTVASTGASATSLAHAAAEGGTITGDTGTDAAGAMSFSGPIIWKPQRNCGMMVIAKVSAVTAYQFEVGFCNLAVGGATPVSAVDDVDTPTYGGSVTNFAGFHIDTTQTKNTLQFVTLGNGASQGSVVTACTGTTNLTADTYAVFVVQLYGQTSAIAHAEGMIGSYLEASHKPTVGAINAATLVTPWVHLGNTTTSQRDLTIDMIAVWQDRPV